MSKKLDKLVDEICSEVEKTVGHRKYVETFLQGIDFSRVDEGIIDEDYEYASDGLEDVFYYYEKSLNDDEYYEKYGDIFTDKVVNLLNELKKELSKFTESKKSAIKSIRESKGSINFGDLLSSQIDYNKDDDNVLYYIFVNNKEYGSFFKWEIYNSYRELLQLDVFKWDIESKGVLRVNLH